MILLLLMACAKAEDKLSALAPFFGDDLNPRVIGATPFPGQSGVSPSTTVGLLFNKAMSSQICTGAFSISPSVTGATVVAGNALTFTPGAALATGTYSVSLSSSCEDVDGRDLETAYNGSFIVGNAGNFAPRVIAVGLESHSNCIMSGSTGSASGGDWTISSCWWDESLPTLTPSSYKFRGGDPACADVNTDNIRLIFNNYMNPGATANATTLRRISGTTTTTRLSSYVWSDCQTTSPFGCRVLTTSFADLDATCGGAGAFGNTAAGDFNLAATAGSAAGFPFYTIQVDTTAQDASGKAPALQFNFTMEGD